MNNFHATLICIDGRGVLIEGPSGSGKSLLALHLYKRCYGANVPVEIIADDQVVLSQKNDVLYGQAPPTLAGKIEVRGFGIVDLPNSSSIKTNIDLHVTLGAAESLIRFWDGAYFEFNNARVVSLKLSSAQLEGAGNAILAALGLPLHI